MQNASCVDLLQGVLFIWCIIFLRYIQIGCVDLLMDNLKFINCFFLWIKINYVGFVDSYRPFRPS